MNASRQQLLRQDFVNNGTEILDRWTTPGQVTTVPKLRNGSSDFVNLNNNSVSRFVEKGDFIRGQNISLGYTFGRDLMDRYKLGKVRVYAQAQNFFLITKYKGVDPEVQNSPTSNTQFGVDYFQNPQQRIYTVGLNVGF